MYRVFTKRFQYNIIENSNNIEIKKKLEEKYSKINVIVQENMAWELQK